MAIRRYLPRLCVAVARSRSSPAAPAHIDAARAQRRRPPARPQHRQPVRLQRRRAAARRHRTAVRGAPVVPLDRVIAVVNDEAVTQYDLREQKRIVLPADEGAERAVAGARRARQAGARAADHRARAAAVRQGQRHPRRRHRGRAHDPARRAGEQDVARRVPQGAREARTSRTRSTARTSAAR